MISSNRPQRSARLLLALAACLLAPGSATAGQQLGDVFTIDMENHNFTQPGSQTNPGQVFGNPAASYINSLITAGNPLAAQVSWASNYQNVAPGVHPSLPNYLWQEGGTNNGVFNDNTPFGPGGANQGNAPNLSGLLQNAGISWKSYQEDINLAKDANGNVTSNVLLQNQWTVPLNNISGTSSAYTNAYNGANQYNFATKHDGQLYYNATNGGNDTSTSNPEVPHYAPLQQLTSDLNNNTVARYNLITPNQYNDMHSALNTNFTYNGVTYQAGSDQESIALGDSFLSKIIPQIMASQAYKNNGAIVIWFDETEGGDDASRTLGEIVLSPLAKGNAYDSTLSYTHSSDLKTLQEVFGVSAPGGGFLGDAGTPGTNDLGDLFQPGVIPAALVPEPSSILMTGLGLAGIAAYGRRRMARRLS
jgi:phosphatidylinositol-3-phosphatase